MNKRVVFHVARVRLGLVIIYITLENSNFYYSVNHSNLNIRAVFLHVLADAFGSVVVITSALLNKYQEQLNIGSDIIHYVDPVLCLILVAIILTTTIPLCILNYFQY